MKRREEPTPAHSFFSSYHIPPENARDFEVSGNFLKGRAGEVDETKNLKKVFGWRKICCRCYMEGVEGKFPRDWRW